MPNFRSRPFVVARVSVATAERTERTDHLENLHQSLEDLVQPLFVLHGRLGKKALVAQLTALDSLADGIPRVVLATDRLVGEGFDHPALDTLVLAMPVA